MNAKQATSLLQFKELFRGSRAKLLALREEWKGETTYILGSGPSLRAREFSRFDNQCVIFLNNTVKLRDSFTPKRELAVITDHLRALELRDFVVTREVPTLMSTDKVLASDVSHFPFAPPAVFVLPSLSRRIDSRGLQITVSRDLGFSEDLLDGMFLGRSVLFPALQAAVYLGAKRIVLCGVDMTNANAEYFDKAIRSNWSEFSYERDARPHFDSILPILKKRGIDLEREFPLGSLEFLPSTSSRA